MKRLNIFQKKTFVILAGLGILYALLVLWPIRSLVGPFLNGRTLVVFTNEAEARPCGGFASAYGVVSAFPPKFELKNVYALAGKSFQPSQYPLSLVSEKQNFWDAGTSTNLEECAESFRQHYMFAENTKINHVFLVDFKTLQDIIGIWNSLSLEGERINAQSFFAKMSRKVADVDRHDEESLATRKSPLASLGKKIILKSLNPTVPPKATRILAKNMQNGSVYSSKASKPYMRQPQDFALTEWNLGGGKSSRYLQKNIEISGREIEPDNWQWKIRFEARHLGGWDEPLSQDWKGLFVFEFPDFLDQPAIQKEASLAPGGLYEQGFIFDRKGTLPETLGLFVPRDQEISYEFSLSALPQQNIQSKNLELRENVAFSAGVGAHPRTDFSVQIFPDEQKPFVTFHKIISSDILPEEERTKLDQSNVFVEIHFSENILLDPDFRAELEDRDYTNKDISENPLYKNFILRPDNHSLIVGFANNVQQLEERYYIKLFGVKDLWGNEMDISPRTVIDRSNSETGS